MVIFSIFKNRLFFSQDNFVYKSLHYKILFKVFKNAESKTKFFNKNKVSLNSFN